MAAGNRIVQFATQRIAGDKEQLAQAEALLPVAARGAVERYKAAMTRAVASLYGLSAVKIEPSRSRLDMAVNTISNATRDLLRRHAERIDASAQLLEVLSHAATLARGYSITRIDGHAVTSVKDVPLGALLEITLADLSLIHI